MATDSPPSPTTAPKETSMNKPITVTTITLVNGVDASKMTNAEIFDLIEALKKIKAQPKKLVAEIAEREAGIAALVAHLDQA